MVKVQDTEASDSVTDVASLSNSEIDIDESTSSSGTLCFDQESSALGNQPTKAVVTDVVPTQFSTQQWEAIMQLSFQHFREQESLKALLFSAGLSHRNRLHDLRAKEQHRLDLVRNEAWVAGERSANRNSISKDLSHKLGLRRLQRQYEKELRSLRRDADGTQMGLKQQLATANEETRKMQAALQSFKERDGYLKQVLKERFDQVNQYEEDLAEIRLDMERRTKYTRELEWSEYQLKQAVAGLQADQADTEKQLRDLSGANHTYAQFVQSLEQRPEDAQLAASDPYKQVGNCKDCVFKEDQNRILREVNHSMAQKIVETRHVASEAQNKMASLHFMAEDMPNAEKIQPQELITLQKQQLKDLRQESSVITRRAKDEIHCLEREVVAMKAMISRLEKQCGAIDADLALAKHSAAEADSFKRQLAIALDMATKKQNERQVRKNVEVLSRERQSFVNELTSLNAHSEAYKTLLSQTLDEMVEAKVNMVEEQHANVELREAKNNLTKKWEELNIKHEEISWKCEHHDRAMKLLSDQCNAELQQREEVIANMQSKLDKVMSYRPATANDQVLALLDMERANSRSIKEHAQLQENEIERLNHRDQRYGYYARAYETIAAHMEWCRNKTQSNMDEVTRFDMALFEEVREEFGEEMSKELRERANRRYREIKKEKEREREEMFEVKDRMVGEVMGQEQDGKMQEGAEELPYWQPPLPEGSEVEGSGSWLTCS